MRSILILAFGVVLSLPCVSQTGNGVDSIPTHVFEAEVTEICSVSLSKDTSATKFDLLPKYNAIIVEFKLLKKIKGSFWKRPSFVLIEQHQSEHDCNFTFVVGHKYRIAANLTRYNSKEIKNRFRKSFFTMYCNDLPRPID